MRSPLVPSRILSPLPIPFPLHFIHDVDGTPLDATTLASYAPGSSSTEFKGDSIDIDIINVEDQDSSSAFEFEYEPEEDTLGTVRATRALSMKGRKNATRASQVFNKRPPPKRTTKAGKKATSEKALASGGLASDALAKRTRSSAVSRPERSLSCSLYPRLTTTGFA